MLEGVPTQRRETSAFSRATAGWTDAWSVPAATDFASRGWSPGSTTGLWPARDGRDLHFVRIDSPDVVTVRSQARGGDGADITKPEDGDFHAFEVPWHGSQRVSVMASCTT